MPLDPHDLPEPVLTFLSDRHLATLTTLRGNGSPHVVPVGFTFDRAATLVRVITSDGSVKVRNAERPRPDGRPGRAAVCQLEGRHWLTLEGPCRISRVREDVTDAEHRYAQRYRIPRVNPRRVVLLIAVDTVLGHV
jgi:PPOX class probable F420-dependent enzyme